MMEDIKMVGFFKGGILILVFGTGCGQLNKSHLCPVEVHTKLK